MVKPDKKVVVCCSSYPFLTYVFSVFKMEEVVVITFSESINEFCTKFGIECDFYKTSNILYYPLDFFRMAIKMRAFAEKYEGCNFLFGHYQFEMWSIYLAQLMSKNGKVYFNNFDHEFYIPIKGILWKSYNFWVLYWNRIMLYFSTGLWTNFYQISTNYYFQGIDFNKLKLLYPVYNATESTLLLNGTLIKSKLNLPKFNLIWLDFGNNHFIIPEEFFEVLSEANRKCPIYVKVHPFQRNRPCDERLFVFNQIPAYLPIELLLGDEVILMGVSSMTLFISKCKDKVSLIKLFEWHDNNFRDIHIDKLTSYGIFMPETMLEFKNWLNDKSYMLLNKH